MSYREIPRNRILRFPSTAGFKGWQGFFTEESTTHPAKMNLRLLRWILKTYTSEGDVICDPMAGTGSTIILAALEGRHGIAVEYEEHFCKMIRDNIKRTERQSSFKPRGKMVCIQGDARELSKLLKESDTIITSPPYSEQNIRDISKEPYGSKRYGGMKRNIRQVTPYSSSPNNIGNLPHGDIEAIITSPPYGSDNANLMERKDKSAQSVLSTTGVRAVPLEEDNIGVLEYGDVDAIVSSPPYGNRLSDEAVQDGDPQRMSYRQAIDSIVTSPPYEQGLRYRGQDHEEVKKKLLAEGYSEEYIKASWSQPHQCQRWAEEGYSEDPNNIGNLRSGSYLEAMLQCYREFYKVLKNSGKLILVTKNFIRNKEVVRLDKDTIKLCEASGFTLKDRWYFKLPQISFWRILYRKKFPSVSQINYEDVLIFEKG